MPHVAFIPLVGFRIREEELLELGMSLPGLQPRAAAIGQLPALGLLTLAGMLPPHWSCSYRPVARWVEGFVAEILAERPALVAISALTASINEAYALADRLRIHRLPVVLGGLHVSTCAEEASRHADSVVIGEAEPVWRQLLDDVEARRLRPIYGSIVGQASPPAINLLPSEDARPTAWPLPRFDLLGDAPPRYTLQTQRGCPLACDFCGASRLLGKFREKPIHSIEQELQAIAQCTPRPLIELADDNTFAGSRDPAELFEALASAGTARYFTEADWRIGERPDVLAGLAASGCAQVLVGIESLVFRYPGMGGKQTELARIMAAVEQVQASGVAVNGCFIVGAEGETRASLDRLAEFILDSPLAEVQLTLQTPFPGTGLYRRLRGEGRLLAERDWSHYTLFDVTYQPDRLSVAELERGFRDLVSAVFSRQASERRNRIRRRILKQRR